MPACTCADSRLDPGMITYGPHTTAVVTSVPAETRGHASGKTRRVPVGNGRKGDSFWVIAEHGTRAGYVRNIQHDPHVRVRLRLGLRYRWVPGVATICPDDDPLARQRHIIAWHLCAH